jgi:hypothetical protein
METSMDKYWLQDQARKQRFNGNLEAEHVGSDDQW